MRHYIADNNYNAYENIDDIEAIKSFYGMTTKQAKQYKKTANKYTIIQIKEYYKTQSKKAFYED